MLNFQTNEAFSDYLRKFSWGNIQSLLKANPKPKKLSQSIYLTCLAVQLLEKLENRFPTQKETDATEGVLKRYRHRKFLKVYKSAYINRFDPD